MVDWLRKLVRTSLWNPLGNQGEHLAQIRSPEIGGCSVQQTIVELHHAAIRVLVAVPQVVKDRFGPSAAARRRSQLEHGPATPVTAGIRTAELGRAV